MFHVAEFNIARLSLPLDHPDNAEFVAALEPVNAIAEASSGFVWRLTDDDGASASYVKIEEIDDPNIIVNYSIWTDVESLQHFVTRSGHSAYLRRRREWFDPSTQPGTVCWWISAGERPAVSEGVARLDHLRSHGPGPRGWTLTNPHVRPDH